MSKLPGLFSNEKINLKSVNLTRNNKYPNIENSAIKSNFFKHYINNTYNESKHLNLEEIKNKNISLKTE